MQKRSEIPGRSVSVYAAKCSDGTWQGYVRAIQSGRRVVGVTTMRGCGNGQMTRRAAMRAAGPAARAMFYAERIA